MFDVVYSCCRRSVSVADAAFGVPLTSSFSVRDSLRSSRVFKTKDAPEAHPEPTKVLGAQSSSQRQSNRAVDPPARAVLQPVGIIASSSRASRASSCGSNSTSGSGGRASYSTLDSAVNNCSSPTDDAQHGASPNGSVSRAAQSQHKPGGRTRLQEHRQFVASTHVPEVAQSCCELLQLLQMDDSLGFDVPAASSSMPARTVHHSSLPLPLERSGSSTQAAARSFPDGLSQQQAVGVAHAGCGGCSPQDQLQGLQRQKKQQQEQHEQEQERPELSSQQPGQLLCHVQGVQQQQQQLRQQNPQEQDSLALPQHRRLQPQQLQQEQEPQQLNMAPNTQPQQQPAATESWAPPQQQGCVKQQAAAPPADGQLRPAQQPQHCVSAAAAAAAAAQQHQSKQQQPDAASHMQAPVQAAWGGGVAVRQQQTLQQPAPSPPRHQQQMTPRRFAAGRHLASPLRPSNTINTSTAFNQQQQHSSTSGLLDAMRTLVANSEAATQHLQFIGASPLKISSPGRFAGRGSVLSRAASGAVSAAPTPRQLSRLSQSWTAASPTGASQPFAKAAAAATAAPPAATAVGAVGDSVRVQLFGDAVGAVAGVLRGTGGQRAATAGASTPGRTASMDRLLGGACCLQHAVVAAAGSCHQGAVVGSTAAPQPLHMGLALSPAGQGSRALCTSRVAQVLFGTPTAQLKGQPASLAVQQSTALDAAGGVSPGISPQGRKLRFGSPVQLQGRQSQQQLQGDSNAQLPPTAGSSSAVPPRNLLQGCDCAVTATEQPLQQEQGLLCKQQRHRSVLGCGVQPLQPVQAVAGKLTPIAARACGSSCTGVLNCAGMQSVTPGAASSRYAGVTDSGATGSTEANDIDSDSDDGGGMDQGLGGHIRDDGAAVSRAKQHLQQQEEGSGECWTVHTNWAAADLDEETAAVAAAAAAAAGLSAQLGRGHPVRLQEHAPFITAAAMRAAGLTGVPLDPAQQQQQQQQGPQAAACSPMWLSRDGGQPVTPAEGSCRQHDVAQQYPPVASPVCLLVPRRLWDSPAAEGH